MERAKVARSIGRPKQYYCSSKPAADSDVQGSNSAPTLQSRPLPDHVTMLSLFASNHNHMIRQRPQRWRGIFPHLFV